MVYDKVKPSDWPKPLEEGEDGLVLSSTRLDIPQCPHEGALNELVIRLTGFALQVKKIRDEPGRMRHKNRDVVDAVKALHKDLRKRRAQWQEEMEQPRKLTKYAEGIHLKEVD